MTERIRKTIIIISASVCLLAVAMLIVLNSGLIMPRWAYFFRPEPTLSRSLGEQRDTAEREPLEITCARDTLDEDLRQVYDQIGTQLSQAYSEYFTADCTAENFRRTMVAYLADHPEVFWLSPESVYAYIDYGDSVDVELRYAFEGDDLREMQDKVHAAATAVIDEAPQTASDYELELYFNDYLINHITYDKETSMPRNVYGGLVNGRAVCAGYSKAFQYLCNRAGIMCTSLFGDILRTDENTELETTLHSWNCIRLDGDWYHIDVTWNDSKNAAYSHAYFNLTDDAIRKTHAVSPLYSGEEESDVFNCFIPECTATEYDYFNKTGVTITDLDDDNDVIAAVIAASRDHRSCAEMRVAENLDFDATAQAIGDAYAFKWLEAANHYNHDNPSFTPSDYVIYKRLRVINLQLKYQ
ncbi:MAG: hypothetical protein IJ598_00180 [Ruminococcus sp.]|nr:hypothetical protein [Ruminococcus sp.]